LVRILRNAKARPNKQKRTQRKTRKSVLQRPYNGLYHHFGQAGVKINTSKKQAQAARNRHIKNLKGSSDRNKAFKIYWNKFWAKAPVK